MLTKQEVCNGSDFTWLDAYDGQICEVYYTALNAKASASGCVYRFLPVAVTPIENFAYPTDKVPAFAIEYGVRDLLAKGTYGSDPALELPNSYSNEIIGATNVALTYSVDNATVGKLTVGESATVLNLLEEGTCEVTITATMGTHTATAKAVVTLNPYADIKTPTVAETIAVADGTEVTLRGVVMSSLVNQKGFYLSDSTGMIAVLVEAEALSDIQPGNELVVKGTKIHKKNEGSTKAGQCVIVGEGGTGNAQVLANYYGDHEYDTSYFVTGKTIDDLCAFDVATDYTTNVYVIDVTIVVQEAQYYSNIYVQDATSGTQITLYCSGSSQYNWLKAFAGKTVTAEIAVCNWNDKAPYKGCVISVTDGDQKVVNSLNFAK